MTKRLEDLPDVMTIMEAAKFLGIGRNTAYEAVRTKQIPSIKIGSRILIPKVGLVKLLQGYYKEVK